jgi:lysozyme family protein
VGAGRLIGTKFGISAAQYPNVDIPNLSVEGAKSIYARDYWAPVHAASLAWPLPLVAFDAAVNEGVEKSIEFLQAAGGTAADGVMGVATMAALTCGDPVMLAREALVRRLDYLASRPGWAEFSLGWTRRVIKLAVELVA